MTKSNDDNINLLDYLIVLLKRKKLIIGITLGAAVITAVISLILPKIYRAETRILASQQSSSIASQMMSQLGIVAGLTGSSLGVKSPNDQYIGMLKSRTVTDKIVDRFGLMKLYDVQYREEARKILIEDVLIATGDINSGIITIAIEDKDPARAADMANALVDELKNLSKGLALTEASQRRLFFEEQLKDIKSSLSKAEESMKGFQEKTGALKLEEQAKAVIVGIANLRAQIAAKEVQLRVMRTYATPQNPDFQKVDDELKGLKSELSKLEAKGGSGHDPLMPTGRMPEVGTEYLRKLRDLKFNEALYELITKQYEAARLDEARDAVVIQIIDAAVSPEKEIKPKKLLIVLITTLTGLFLSIFASFFIEYKEQASADPENKEKLILLRKLSGFKKASMK